MRKEGGTLVVEIVMPDLREDEINIVLRKEKISVSAEKREIRYEKEEGYFRSSRMLKHYRVSETLPARIMPEKAGISYENGILRIEAPLDEDKGDRIETLVRKESTNSLF
jgi:HSP20 family molecular chaperone IbpA